MHDNAMTQRKKQGKGRKASQVEDERSELMKMTNDEGAEVEFVSSFWFWVLVLRWSIPCASPYLSMYVCIGICICTHT